MTIPNPFAHPESLHERRHGPYGYNPYDGYKPWLRDEFTFRCVYCLERELWYPDRSASFSADHVVPQSEDAALICEYTNLIYACTRCNAARRDVRVPDPTAVAFGHHLQIQEDGLLLGMTPEGRDLIELLHLNRNPALKVRRLFLTLFRLKEQLPTNPDVDTLFMEAFGFPDDMPDLRAKRPPGGNKREGSEQGCYFARKERGELPRTY